MAKTKAEIAASVKNILATGDMPMHPSGACYHFETAEEVDAWLTYWERQDDPEAEEVTLTRELWNGR